MFARLFIAVLLLLTLHFAFLTTSYAQSATPSASTMPQTLTPIPSQISPTSPIYTDMLMHNMFHTFSCLAAGSSVIGQPCLTYQAGIPVLSQANLSGGILGTTTSLLGAVISTPPIRTANYVAYVGENLGFAKVAHAQNVVGSGANILDPILNLWKVSRNIAYLLMTLIFIVIGLMIVFRNKINPQTVITAQAALPGLVIGLFLITFSYFLSALISDTAFIGTNLLGSYFSAAQSQSPGNLSQELERKSILNVMSAFVGSVGQGEIHGAVSTVIGNLGTTPKLVVSTAASFLSFNYAYQFAPLPAQALSAAGCGVAGAIGVLNPVAAVAGSAAEAALTIPNCIRDWTETVRLGVASAAAVTGFALPSTPISWAIFFILIFVLIYTMIKLLFRLVSCFLSIIFLTVTAPFQFLFASLPGRQGIATGWIMSMLSNVLAFPAVIGVLYFVNYLLGSSVNGGLPVTGGPVNLVSGSSFPLLGGLTTDFIRVLVAVGALLATPTIPDIIARAIGSVSQAGQMLGQEITGGFRSGQGYAGRFSHETSQASEGYLDQNPYVREGGKWIKAGEADSEYLRAQMKPGMGSKAGTLWRKFRGG